MTQTPLELAERSLAEAKSLQAAEQRTVLQLTHMINARHRHIADLEAIVEALMAPPRKMTPEELAERFYRPAEDRRSGIALPTEGDER